MGKPFEEICKEYFMVHPELMIIEIGSWWGSDLHSKQEEEIDIVARTADGELIRRSKESEDVVLVSLDDLMK